MKSLPSCNQTCRWLEAILNHHCRIWRDAILMTVVTIMKINRYAELYTILTTH